MFSHTLFYRILMMATQGRYCEYWDNFTDWNINDQRYKESLALPHNSKSSTKTVHLLTEDFQVSLHSAPNLWVPMTKLSANIGSSLFMGLTSEYALSITKSYMIFLQMSFQIACIIPLLPSVHVIERWLGARESLYWAISSIWKSFFHYYNFLLIVWARE